jgi:hypothetical protein
MNDFEEEFLDDSIGVGFDIKPMPTDHKGRCTDDEFEKALKDMERADCKAGYPPERYSHDCYVVIQDVLRYANRLTDHQLEVLVEAKCILKELANGK